MGSSLGWLSCPAFPPSVLFKFPVILSLQPGLGCQRDVLGVMLWLMHFFSLYNQQGGTGSIFCYCGRNGCYHPLLCWASLPTLPLASLPCLCPSVPRWNGRTQCSVFDTSLVPVMLLDPWPWTQLLRLHQQLFFPSIYKPYFYAVCADLDMKLAWFPAVWEYFDSSFSPKWNYLLLMKDMILKSLQDSVASLWSKHKNSTCSSGVSPLSLSTRLFQILLPSTQCFLLC